MKVLSTTAARADANPKSTLFKVCPCLFLCLPRKPLGPIYDFQECVSDMVTLFNYSGTPPYGHLGVTATFFRPGKAAIHFLIKKMRKCGHPLIRSTATF